MILNNFYDKILNALHVQYNYNAVTSESIATCTRNSRTLNSVIYQKASVVLHNPGIVAAVFLHVIPVSAT